MREEGKEPMTIWLSHDEKLRLEDLAQVWRSSPSAMLSQALARFHPGSPSVPGTVADTAQLRGLVAEMVADILARDTAPGDTCYGYGRNLSDTLAPEKPQKYEAGQGHSLVTAPEQDAATGYVFVTEPAPARKGGRPRSELGQRILALLQMHPEGLTAEQLRASLAPERPLGDVLQGMRRQRVIHTRGRGKATRYYPL